jgi:hypothetical protein
VDVDLALVVHDAAAPHATVADGGLERRALPLVEGIDRLHVVVPVDEERRLARRVVELCEHRGVPLRRPHLDALGTERAEILHQVLGVLHEVRFVRGIARDRRDLHLLLELLHEAAAVLIDEREDVFHGQGFSIPDRGEEGPLSGTRGGVLRRNR